MTAKFKVLMEASEKLVAGEHELFKIARRIEAENE
jgi:hypothetical protein